VNAKEVSHGPLVKVLGVDIGGGMVSGFHLRKIFSMVQNRHFPPVFSR